MHMRCSYPNSVIFKNLKRGYRRGFAILRQKLGKMPYQFEKDVYFVRLCAIQFSWIVYSFPEVVFLLTNRGKQA